MLPYTACANAGFADETSANSAIIAVNPINLDRNIPASSLEFISVHDNLEFSRYWVRRLRKSLNKPQLTNSLTRMYSQQCKSLSRHI